MPTSREMNAPANHMRSVGVAHLVLVRLISANTLGIVVAVSMTWLAALGAEPLPGLIKVGMSFTEANTILSAAGLSGHEREPGDVITVDHDRATRHFPVQPNVDLVISYSEASGKIKYIWLETIPKHVPAKGLEVDLPLLDIVVHADGTFSAHVDAPDKSKSSRPNQMMQPTTR